MFAHDPLTTLDRFASPPYCPLSLVLVLDPCPCPLLSTLVPCLWSGRDVIIRSICPQLYGMFYVKLSLLLTLIGGNQTRSDRGVRRRSQSHMLICGDPGCGKSQLMRFAVAIAPRSVLTTGIGRGLFVLHLAATSSHCYILSLHAHSLQYLLTTPHPLTTPHHTPPPPPGTWNMEQAPRGLD